MAFGRRVGALRDRAARTVRGAAGRLARPAGLPTAAAGLLERLRAAVRERIPRLPRRAGFLVAPDEVVGVLVAPGLRGRRVLAVARRPVAGPEEEGSWPALGPALEELARRLGCGPCPAGVALRHPLARAKTVTAPPLGREDLARYFSRTARRHFLVGREPTLADAVPRGLGLRRGGAAVAACARRSVVEAVETAVGAAGLRLETVVPASVVLAEEAAPRLARRAGATVVVARSGGWREGIVVDRRGPLRFEVWRTGEAAEVDGGIEALEREAERVGSGRPPTVRVLEGFANAEGGRERRGTDPAVMAARGAAAAPARAPRLVGPALRADARGRELRRASLLAASAAMLAVVAAVVHLLGLQRHLEAVDVEREALAPTVEEVQVERSRAEALGRRLAALARAEASMVRWTPAVAALADALPESAHLLSLSAEGRRMQMGGVASAPADVVPALEAHPVLRDVQLVGARTLGPTPGSAAEGGSRFDLVLEVASGGVGAGERDPGGEERP